MTEIAGEGAIFVDPSNPVAAARAIAENLAGSEMVKLAASENLKRFAIDEVRKRYQNLYASIVPKEH